MIVYRKVEFELESVVWEGMSILGTEKIFHPACASVLG